MPESIRDANEILSDLIEEITDNKGVYYDSERLWQLVDEAEEWRRARRDKEHSLCRDQ